MWINVGIIALASVVLVFYLIEKIRKYSVKSVLLKTFVSILFMVVAIYSSYANGGRVMNIFIILGLLFGLTGDIWLDLKYVYPEQDKIYSYAGFIVFGIGHILFMTGMFLEFLGDAHFLYVLLPIVGGVVVSIANLFIAKPLKIVFGDMTAIAFAYSITLFSMPLCALSLLIANGWASQTLLMMFIGGLLFAISDLVLSQTYFKDGHEKPIDFVLNYLFYYGAQFVIAFSILFL